MSLLSYLFKLRISEGTLCLIHPNGHKELIEGIQGKFPKVTIRLHDPYLLIKLLKSPNLAFGEAYMNGGFVIESGTLHELLYLCTQNDLKISEPPFSKALCFVSKLTRFFQTLNTRKKSLQNVAHHYDLNKDFYSLFLDPDKQYSCAYFLDKTNTIAQAQRQKKDHIAAKLDLKPGQKILDIGCGWGGMALYLAQQEDVEVTGLTLSREQLAIAKQRAHDLKLQDRVRFYLKDYREEKGHYDRIVSVGMFEHVGPTQYKTFFQAIRDLLLPQGKALLHSIGRSFGSGRTCPWIQKYIFPGGYCPALSEVLSVIEQKKLFIHDIEVLHDHYALTLQAWRKNFLHVYEEATRLYDDTFCKMWEYYLTAAEIAFQTQGFMVFQILMHKNRATLPLTRNSFFENECVLSQSPLI